MITDNYEYDKILVIGSQKVGKTSIFSRSLNNHFGEEYYPTRKVERFYDSRRRLEFIDCPGLLDEILFKREDIEASRSDFSKLQALNHKDILKIFKRKYEGFAKDTFVQELVNAKPPGERNFFLKEGELLKVRAYLIVYNDDLRTQEMAKALRYRLLQAKTKKNFFVVKNIGEIDRGVGSTRKPMDYSLDKHYSQMKPIEKNFSLIFNPKRDLSSMKWFGDPRMTYLQPVSAKTGEGLNDMLDSIARRFRRQQYISTIDTNKESGATDRAYCQPGTLEGYGCSIQ